MTKPSHVSSIVEMRARRLAELEQVMIHVMKEIYQYDRVGFTERYEIARREMVRWALSFEEPLVS